MGPETYTFQAWLKRERDSLDRGLLDILLKDVRACGAGVYCDTPFGPKLKVPIIGVWLVDHPQHQWMCACRCATRSV